MFRFYAFRTVVVFVVFFLNVFLFLIYSYFVSICFACVFYVSAFYGFKWVVFHVFWYSCFAFVDFVSPFRNELSLFFSDFPNILVISHSSFPTLESFTWKKSKKNGAKKTVELFKTARSPITSSFQPPC